MPCLHHPTISRISRTPTCDRQTDRQTDTHKLIQGHYSIYRAKQSSCGENHSSPSSSLRRFLTQTTTTTTLTTMTNSNTATIEIPTVSSVDRPAFVSPACKQLHNLHKSARCSHSGNATITACTVVKQPKSPQSK